MFFNDYLPPWLFNSIFPIVRWLHIIGGTLLVGGTLFYEFVVPIALEDLKEEQQLAVFGRVRWVFAKVVWLSAIIMLITGLISSVQFKYSYDEQYPLSKPWWMAHTTMGLISLAIALRLTVSRRVPPISWMRLNLILLLVVVFLASTARHVRITLRDKIDRQQQQQPQRLKLRTPVTSPSTLAS